MSLFDCRNMTMKAVDECPFCHSHNIKKNGKEHNHQRWYCKECHRSFSSRTGTILNSSKLRPVQIRRMVSMLSDGVLFHQVAHQIGVSVQTVCLWKRKLQALVKSQETSVLSGKVYADHHLDEGLGKILFLARSRNSDILIAFPLKKSCWASWLE